MLQRLAEIVAAARRSSSRPLVVIVHGDHGPGYRFDPARPDAVGAADRFSILLALGPRASFTDTPPMSPVNVYRTLFRESFGAPLENLPDRRLVPDGDFPFRFVEVTDRWRSSE
jgi:hypothetical protein